MMDEVKETRIDKVATWKAHDKPKVKVIAELGYNVKFGEDCYTCEVLAGKFKGGKLPILESKLKWLD